MFLLQSMGILPLVLTTAAYVDGSHGVRVCCTAGQFELRLTHGPAAGTAANPAQCHHHGPLARVMCLLAKPNPMEPDHQIQLANGMATDRLGRESLLRERALAAAILWHPPTLATRSGVLCGMAQIAPEHPPPSSFLHVFLQSVCLTI
ncbi:MAG: hypothetical protein HY301_11020 [Verrucomicrobia bacterium]|nr:hypothetical protein [Verrucomicrobiota bacterium]